MSNADPKPGGFFDHLVVKAAELNIMRQGVLNALDIGGGARTMLAKLTLLGTDMFELGGQLLYSSRVINRSFGLGHAKYDPAQWELSPAGAALTYANTLSTGANPIKIDLHDLPHGNVLTDVVVFFKGPAANGTTPVTLPTLSVYAESLSTGNATQLGSTTTVVYGSPAAYKTYQAVTVAGLAHTIDRTQNNYVCMFTSEGGGGGALAGAHLYPGRTVCTVTKQPVGY